MKRIAIIFIMIFISAAILVSPTLASEQSYQTTPTTTPTPVTWKVYQNSWPDDYDNVEMDDPLDVTYVEPYGYGDASIPKLEAGIVCVGTDCVSNDIYYSINVSANWTAKYYTGSDYYSGSRTLVLHIQISPSKTITVELPCGSGHDSSCMGENINGVIPADELYWNEGNDRNSVISATISGDLVNASSTVIELNVKLSTEPIDCESSYVTEDDIASGNINPTVENPTPITLTQGSKYRLELSGGPWNSTRYDAAFSLDGGTTWKVISANPTESGQVLTTLDDIECTTKYEDGKFVMYFTSPSTSFRIRVNDTPGAFGNNTGSLTYRLTNVRAAAGECASQYAYDPQQNLLASGTLILTDTNGQLLGAQEGSYAYTAASTALSRNLGLAPAAIAPNQHYVLTLTGAWQDSGGGLNKSTYQAKQSTTGSWQDFGSTEQEGCLVTSDNTVQYYFQVNGDGMLYVRPRALDANWSNNTGTVQWAVYGVTFTPRPNACSSTITLGELIGSGTVEGAKEGGTPLPNVNKVAIPATGGVGDPIPQPDLVQRYIAIETVDGPWRDNGAMSYLIEITVDGGTTWHQLDTWAQCGVMLDKYHFRAYLLASVIWEHIPDALDGNIVNNMIKLRAKDGNSKFSDNTGSINFRWYQATNQEILQGTIGVGTCNANFSHAVSATATVPVNAKSAAGVYLPDMPITSQVALYAVETTGAWKHSAGDTDHYDIQFSDDGGSTWHEVTDYDPPIQCAQYIGEEDHHLLIYYAPIQGTRYKVRVNDDDNTFAANPVGTLAVKIYTATGSFDAWTNCGSQYSLVPVGISNPQRDLTALQRGLLDLDGWLNTNMAGLYALSVGFPSIEANLMQGVPLEYQFNNGLAYAISTYAGGWGEACLGACSGTYTNKAIEISFNNGQQWTPLVNVPGKACILDLESGHKRVYFAAPMNSNVVRLRVAGDDFANLGGSIEYILFAVTGTSSPIYTSSTVPNWAASCTTQCVAPQLVASVDVAGVSIPVPNADFGAWLSYLGCRLEYFFSWCPEHTAMLINLFSYFKGHEPFGTFYEVISLIDSARAEAEAYTFVDECSPDPAIAEGGGDPMDSIIPVLNDESPWNGGPAIAEPAVGGWGDGTGGFAVSASTQACYAQMSNQLGNNATYGFMMAVELMKRAFGGFILTYIGLAFQVAIIGFGLVYFQKRWQVIAW